MRGASRMRLQHAEGEKIAVFCGERPLFAYCYDTARPKPYVHPLYLPNGDPVTVDGPRDHVHHRGLMVAWSELDGIDFWGETNPAPHGKIVHQKFETLRCDARAEIVAVRWLLLMFHQLLNQRPALCRPPVRRSSS
jgi:Methane oxygenase PmoA